MSSSPWLSFRIYPGVTVASHPLPTAHGVDMLSEMRRVAILGPAASGKSRLAQDLGDATGIRVVYLDRLFWRPGWQVWPEDEWEAIQQREAIG